MSLDEFLSWQAVGKLVVLALGLAIVIGLGKSL